MEDIIYYNNLYDYYHQLLTEKQRSYFEDYYFNNLSLAEMALNYKVSRNAISKQLKIIILKLIDYEEKLSLLQKKQKIKELLNKNDFQAIKDLI